MVDEPDNMVLRLLREIRAKQDTQEREFAVLKQEVATLREAVVTGFTAIGARLDALEQDMVVVKQDMVAVKQDMVVVKQDMVAVKQDMAIVKDAQGSQARHLNGLVNIVSSHDNTLLLIARHLGLVRA